MKRKIEVLAKEGHWWVRNPFDAETIRLFGTDTIPTPFSTAIRRSSIDMVLRDLNPDAEIVFVD